MEEYKCCGEEINRSPDCLFKFNIMDDEKSFVKTDEDGNFRYIWCVNCKNHHKKLEEFMEKNKSLYEEEKKEVKEEDEFIIKKKHIKRILNDENYRKKFLEKNKNEYDKLIKLEDEMFKAKERKRELKAIRMNEMKELSNKTRDIHMKEVLELNEKSILKPEFKKILFKHRIYEIKAIKCHKCDLYLCFPFNFEKIYYYYKFKIPEKYYHNCKVLVNNIWNTRTLPNICDSCFDRQIKKNMIIYDKYIEKNTYVCPCGKYWCSLYKKKSKKWKEEIKKHQESNYIHLLYENDMDIFCDLRDKLGFNLYTRKRNELKEFVKNHKINFIINEKMTSREILKGLIDLFKKNNNSFPIINDDYEIFNFLSRDELRFGIIEFKLKIPYYNKLTKDKLIKAIINYE